MPMSWDFEKVGRRATDATGPTTALLRKWSYFFIYCPTARSLLTYVCPETKYEMSTDHDPFFAKYRIFIGKVPQVHKGTVHHL